MQSLPRLHNGEKEKPYWRVIPEISTLEARFNSLNWTINCKRTVNLVVWKAKVLRLSLGRGVRRKAFRT